MPSHIPSALELITQILEQAAAFNGIEWIATLSGLVYVILAARNNALCWSFGIVSCSFWAYASYAYYDLYLDAILQLFYVVMGFVGVYQWQFGNKDREQLPISEWPWQRHAWWALGGAVASVLFGYFFATYTQAAATYWDAFTTVFSVIATVLLIRRVRSNWLYWIVVDTIYVGLYSSREAYLFALLMLIYLVVAMRAYVLWQHQKNPETELVRS